MTEMTRRSALRGAGLAVGTLAVASAITSGVLDPVDAFAADAPEKTSLTPAQAEARLKVGNQRFVSGRLRHPRREGPRRAAVAEGQAPYAVVLGCADSRVPPEVIYDQGLGDLFVTRIAGNTATDPFVIGTVEYGAVELGAVLIVVLGHEQCGACKAAIDVAQNGTELPGDIGAFVAPIVPIAQQLISTTPKDQLLEAVTHENIRQAMANLQQDELLAGLVSDGKLAIAGGEYEFETGRVEAIEP
jgi:carbonic anhydrase